MSSSLPTACPSGFYGPDCALECTCQNGGSCNRFSGCVCPAGWHGQHCEKSGEIGTGLWQVSIPHPLVGTGSFLISSWEGHWLLVSPAGSAGPLGCGIRSKSVETRTLQGQHLVWYPSIICVESVAEPSMWVGDQGWTTASITFPLAPQSGRIWVQEKVSGFLVGEEQGQL